MQFDKYSVSSLNNISEEHIEFILIISKLYNAAIKNLPNSEIIMLLDDLENYTRIHFQLEDKIYNHLKPNIHSIKNGLLIEKLDEYRTKFESSILTVDELFNYIFNWLLTHLKNHEIEFNEFIEETKLNIICKKDFEEHIKL